MIVCSSSYIRVQAANEVAQNAQFPGFNITVKSMEYSEYKRAFAGNFDLYYGEVRLSPNFDLSPFFGATGTLNYGDLADSTMMNCAAWRLSTAATPITSTSACASAAISTAHPL